MSAITTTSALVSWTAVTGAISYYIQYRVSGTGTWSNTTSTTTSVTISGLTPGTLYEVQVQTVCSITSSSLFTGSSVFSTLGITTYISTILADCSSINIYPNPATDDVTIAYNLSDDHNVSIEIFNIIGQKVNTVVNNEMQQKGTFNYTVSLPFAGIYFVKCSIGNISITKKIQKI
jgi:hypothetical protein